MDISLRKAAALQISIAEALKALKLDTAVSVSIHEPDVQGRIEAANAAWKASWARRKALLDALYDIRKKVSEANQAAGVGDLLAHAARVEKDIQSLSDLVSVNVRESSEIISARIERMKTREDAPQSRFTGVPQDEIRVSLVDEAEKSAFESELRALKRTRQSLKDALLEANARAAIRLSVATVEILQAEELV
jgi:predicted O-linked N-acetylglucosamine transferase (SPINDLY family)